MDGRPPIPRMWSPPGEAHGPWHPRLQPPSHWPDTDTARRFWSALTAEQMHQFILLGPPEGTPDRTAPASGSAPDPSPSTHTPPRFDNWGWGDGKEREDRFLDAVCRWVRAFDQDRAAQRTAQSPTPRGPSLPIPTPSSPPPTPASLPAPGGGRTKRNRPVDDPQAGPLGEQPTAQSRVAPLPPGPLRDDCHDRLNESMDRIIARK